MILTISGAPGSGKTSVAHLLASQLRIPYYSIGSLRGKMALERGLTLDEFNRLGETDETTDTLVDEYQTELGKRDETCIIEGRLSWHFIPNSFKIFLDCNPQTAAERIFRAKQLNGDRPDEPTYTSVMDAAHWIRERVASDGRRYEKYYGVNFLDPSHYDLVIDTSRRTSAEDTANAVLEALAKKA